MLNKINLLVLVLACVFIVIASVNCGGSSGSSGTTLTITIGDFLTGWVVMDGAHTGVDIDPKIWITGPVSYTGSGGTVDEPLTVTREEGDGRILYTSYHTAHSCPTTGFWPQERILQYLVFKL
jgi:hypothetical protein